MFHVAPSQYRKENISVSLTKEMDIVQRDFKNKNKDIIVDYFCQEFREIRLLGKEALFHPEISCEMEEFMHKCLDFAEEYIIQGTARRFFSITRFD